MGKLISWLALAFFIVVVPFISWYYLRQGLNYRKSLMAEVMVKDSIPVSIDTLMLFKGKTTVFSYKGFENNPTMALKIFEQFQNIPKFQLLGVDSVANVKVFPKDYLRDYLSKYSENQLVLIDTALKIRNTYGNDVESIKKLVEHIAAILPHLKESDIEIKN